MQHVRHMQQWLSMCKSDQTAAEQQLMSPGKCWCRAAVPAHNSWSVIAINLVHVEHTKKLRSLVLLDSNGFLPKHGTHNGIL